MHRSTAANGGGYPSRGRQALMQSARSPGHIDRADLARLQVVTDALTADLVALRAAMKAITKRLAKVEQVWVETGEPPALETILEACAKAWGVTVNDLKSKRKARVWSRPRMAYCWIAKNVTFLGFKEIAAAIGNRDHTTAMHACTRVDELRRKDRGFAKRLVAAQRAIVPAAAGAPDAG